MTKLPDREKVSCPLRVGGVTLPQVEEFILFTGEGKMECELDRSIGATSAVMKLLYRSVAATKKLCERRSSRFTGGSGS